MTAAAEQAGPRSRASRPVAAGRAVGVAGLATVVLVFVPAILRSGREPGFDATADQALAFFRSVSTSAAELEEVVSTVGLVAFVWFAVGLGSLLRTVEPGLPWRAGVVPASAGVVVTLGLVGDWDAAAYRATDLDPQIARFAFDMGNRSFANGWVALGGLAVCAGWVVASTTWLPHWLGWWAVVSGVGLALCRIWWTSSIWFLPYSLFWLWVITVSVLLLRRPLPAGLEGR